MFDASRLAENQKPFSIEHDGKAVAVVVPNVAYRRETKTLEQTGRWRWCAGFMDDEWEIMGDTASRKEAIVSVSEWLRVRVQAEIAKLHEIEQDTNAILEALA